MILLERKFAQKIVKPFAYGAALVGFRLLLAFSPHLVVNISEYREGLEIYRNLNGDQRRELEFALSQPERGFYVALKESDVRNRPNGTSGADDPKRPAGKIVGKLEKGEVVNAVLIKVVYDRRNAQETNWLGILSTLDLRGVPRVIEFARRENFKRLNR